MIRHMIYGVLGLAVWWGFLALVAGPNILLAG